MNTLAPICKLAALMNAAGLMASFVAYQGGAFDSGNAGSLSANEELSDDDGVLENQWLRAGNNYPRFKLIFVPMELNTSSSWQPPGTVDWLLGSGQWMLEPDNSPEIIPLTPSYVKPSDIFPLNSNLQFSQPLFLPGSKSSEILRPLGFSIHGGLPTPP